MPPYIQDDLPGMPKAIAEANQKGLNRHDVPARQWILYTKYAALCKDKKQLSLILKQKAALMRMLSR